MTDFPIALERELNQEGIFFHEVARGKFIIRNENMTPTAYLGRSPLWRVDPADIRNYFDSRQEAYAALEEISEDLDLSAFPTDT